LFPTLPAFSQFNRLLLRYGPMLEGFLQFTAAQLARPEDLYEAVDGCAVLTRDRRRRGLGWLCEATSIGKSNRLGFYEGLHLLDAVTADGVLTGYLVAPAATHDQRMLDAFLAMRCGALPPNVTVGRPRSNTYLADKGFSSDGKQQERWQRFGARVVSAPQRGHGRLWDKADRRWLARHRQIVETVHDKLLHAFRLATDRLHTLEGFRARLAAKAAAHNFCIWLNRRLGRPNLAFADILGW
jgi:hypothetical protein